MAAVIGEEERKMKPKTRNHYIATLVAVVLLVASTAFALIGRIPATVPIAASKGYVDEKEDRESNNTVSISMMDGAVQRDGKTGWEIIIDLASRFK